MPRGRIWRKLIKTGAKTRNPDDVMAAEEVVQEEWEKIAIFLAQALRSAIIQ